MQKIKYFLIFFVFNISIQSGNTTNPISIEAFQQFNISTETNTNISVFKQLQNWVKKQYRKALDANNIKKLGLVSLIAGILSLIALFAISVGSWVWVPAAILAIIGDILAIVTLLKTRNSKKENKLARRLAIWGLITSLLTGFLPLLLLVLVLISLN